MSKAIDITERYSDMINYFKQAARKGIREVSISFLLLNIDKTQDEIYRDIFDLLELKVLTLREYSICPCCRYHNNIKELIKCKRCSIYYNVNSVDESFSIDEKYLTEEVDKRRGKYD